MRARARRVWRTVLVGAVAATALAACGDDDETATTEASGASTTAAADEGGTNELKIDMVDYGYEIEGTLKAGLATITSTNSGNEWHMAGLGKLKDGATVEALVKALQAAGEGGEGEDDPTAEFIEKEIDTPGHILQPGQTQSLTVDVLEPGNYVLLCFIPTEGEGAPHFAKGMVSGFEVAEGESGAEEPQADAAITLGDEAEATGVPTDLESGKRTFKVTSSGSKGKDFFIGQLKDGKTVDDFDSYFSSFEKEGGPPKGFAAEAPGSIFGSTFEIQPGQTIWMTVELKKGETLFINTTNSDDENADDDATVDKIVTVNVT